VPVFNEQESIGIFLDTVAPLMERHGFRFEIVFVNDGSHDNTLAHLLDRSARDRRLRVVNLSRNFGKEAALTAASTTPAATSSCRWTSTGRIRRP